MQEIKFLRIEEKGTQERLNIFDIVYINKTEEDIYNATKKEELEKRWTILLKDSLEVLEDEILNKKYMSQIIVLKIEEKGTQGRLNIFDIVYLNKKKQVKRWNIFSRNTKEILEKELFYGYENIDGISIYAIHRPSNKLVLIKEFRTAINGYLYTLPAGIKEEDETSDITAQRELHEETGLRLTEITKIDRPRYSAVGLTNEKIVMAYGFAEGEVSKKYQSANEESEILLIDSKEAKRILEEEKIAGRTALILENYILQCELAKYKKEIKTVGFDMDGVLAEFDEGFLEKLNERLGTNYTKANLTEWNFKNIFGEIANEILSEDGFFLNLKPKIKMIAVLKTLIAEGKEEVAILTACDPKSFLEKVEWLSILVPELSPSLIIPIRNKDNYNADLLIDDGVHNIRGFRRKTIIVDANYNREVTDVTRITDEDSVEDIIRKIRTELYE